MKAEHVAGGVNDSDIGLMRNEPADFPHVALSMGQDVERRVSQDPDSPFEDSATIHRQIMKALFESGRRRRDPAAAGWPAQEIAARPVGAELVGDQPLIRISWREQHGAGAVTEQGEALLVARVDDAAIAVAANDQAQRLLPVPTNCAAITSAKAKPAQAA